MKRGCLRKQLQCFKQNLIGTGNVLSYDSSTSSKRPSGQVTAAGTVSVTDQEAPYLWHLVAKQVNNSSGPAGGKLRRTWLLPGQPAGVLDAQYKTTGAFTPNRDTGQWKTGYGRELWDKFISFPYPFKA